MFNFIRRRRQAVQESEIQRLRDNFGLSSQFSHGIPHNVHRLAVDNRLGLVAVITKSGLVELYNNHGQKTVLLKKLGSPSTFFEFVEGTHQLLVVCVPDPSSNLFESYHLIKTDESDSCSSMCRPKSSPKTACFCLARLPDYERCLLTGCEDGSVNLLNLASSSKGMEVESLLSVSELLDNKELGSFTDISATSDLIICCFRHTLVVVICASTRKLLKTIELSRRYTANSVNESQGAAFFVSTETITTLSLHDLKLQSSGLEAKCFERTDWYRVGRSARTNELVTMYSTGIPDCWMRRSGAFVIVHQGELTTFSLSSQLLDVRLVFAHNSKEKISAVLLLCEHELVAIDLMDPQLRCVNLNCLRCIDSSPVTTIRVEQLETDDPLFSAPCSQYSRRRRLFDEEDEAPTRLLDSVVFTGHENGDIFIWDMRDGSQRLLQTFRAVNFIATPSNEGENDGERKEEQSGEEFEVPFTEVVYGKKKDEREINENMAACSLAEWGANPARLWRDSKSRKSVEVGVYDDRSEDDRLAVESFHYCPRRQTLVCGLHGGMVIAATASNSECDFAHEDIDEIKTVEVRQSEIEQTNALQSPLQYKKPTEWTTSIFIPHLFQLTILPQTPVRCVSYCEKSCVTIAGTSTGIVAFNSMNGRILFAKSFLSLGDIEVVLAEEKPLTRLKTMKQTMRKTFRKRSIRMSRTGRQVERQVEFRDSQMPVNNGVRCIRFHSTPSNKRIFFVGTANATVFVFELDTADSCSLIKEIRLSHRAPIISIDIVKVERQTRVIVFTEEQIRCFSLEGTAVRPLKFSCKLTAKCGIQLRRACVFRSTETSYDYLGMLCNDGNVLAISANDPRVRVHERFTAADNSLAIRTSAINETSEFAFVGANSCTLTMASCNPTRTESSWRTNAFSSVPFDL